MSAAEPRCQAFQWLGQDFAHCDNCGRDIREHAGMYWPNLAEGVVPFETVMERVPLFRHYATPTNAPRPFRWESDAEVSR